LGEAERRLREFFALGRATSPAILFIDELEAIVGSREAAGGGDEVQQRVLSTLLNEMDGVAALSQVLLIGATNRPDLLDAALLRPGRFDRQIVIDNPDVRGRKEIYEVHLKNMRLDNEIVFYAENLAVLSPGELGRPSDPRRAARSAGRVQTRHVRCGHQERLQRGGAARGARQVRCPRGRRRRRGQHGGRAARGDRRPRVPPQGRRRARRRRRRRERAGLRRPPRRRRRGARREPRRRRGRGRGTARGTVCACSFGHARCET
jgi:hypothetical protein